MIGEMKAGSHPGMTCDICHQNTALGVAASRVGPMSMAMCGSCIDHMAEPEWAFEYLFDVVSDNGRGLAKHVTALTTYKGGRYVTWDDWSAARLAAGGA